MFKLYGMQFFNIELMPNDFAILLTLFCEGGAAAIMKCPRRSSGEKPFGVGLPPDKKSRRKKI